MIYKGVVSGYNGSKIQVTISSLSNAVVASADVARDMAPVNVGDIVIVASFFCDLSDCCVIGVIK